MPDVMQDGSNELIYWIDELCHSCGRKDECPLVRAIIELGLITYSGCHVAYCNEWDGAENPRMTMDSDVEEARPVNIITQIQALTKQLKETEAASRAAEELNTDE